MAAWKGNTSIIELLLKESALITSETAVSSVLQIILINMTVFQSGKTPLGIAQEEKQHEAITVLQAASVRVSDESYLIAIIKNAL